VSANQGREQAAGTINVEIKRKQRRSHPLHHSREFTSSHVTQQPPEMENISI